MRKTLISSLIGGAALAFSMTAAAADITGAGASFPYPIYAKWAEAYKAATGKALNYQSIGSSGGIKQIRAKTVDFGATDDPMKAADLEKDGMVQFPAIMGGVVAIYNLPGVSDIKLNGEVLADMFMGWIVNWNDPKIAALNPGVKFPDQTITVSHRADGSGTTKVFTDYLTKVSPRWKEKVGSGSSVQWPAAASVGGKGNAGVAANVSKIRGSIG
ncbi:MAG: phosphate ABC transporter substrate-binding protein PstS, partial [Burkholderiaceae bacterium]